jgi:integrase/recombinase XerC
MFQQYLNDFIHHLRFEKRCSPHTITAYNADILQFCTYLSENYNDTGIGQVTHFHLRSWLAELKEKDQLQARSLNRKISSINGYYRFLLSRELIQKNPVRQLHALRVPERLPVFLREQETTHLLEDIAFGEGFKSFTDRMILELLYGTGMRRHELSTLKESDVEWKLQQLRVLGKGNKERLIPLSDNSLEHIRAYLKAKEQEGITGPHLLALPSGKPLYDTYIYRRVKHYLSQVSTLKKKSPHILRHTFATHLLNNGANIQAIKELLGHSGIAATQIYTHINIDELKKVHKLNHPRG